MQTTVGVMHDDKRYTVTFTDPVTWAWLIGALKQVVVSNTKLELDPRQLFVNSVLIDSVKEETTREYSIERKLCLPYGVVNISDTLKDNKITVVLETKHFFLRLD
jgi:hypothetical protein